MSRNSNGDLGPWLPASQSLDSFKQHIDGWKQKSLVVAGRRVNAIAISLATGVSFLLALLVVSSFPIHVLPEVSIKEALCLCLHIRIQNQCLLSTPPTSNHLQYNRSLDGVPNLP